MLRLAVIAGLVLLAASDLRAQAADIFAPNAPLPRLELPTIDGKRSVDLGELTGKPTLLIQFASW